MSKQIVQNVSQSDLEIDDLPNAHTYIEDNYCVFN